MQLQKKHEYIIDVFGVSILLTLFINLISEPVHVWLKARCAAMLPHLPYAYPIVLACVFIPAILGYLYLKARLSKEKNKIAHQSLEERQLLLESLERRYEERFRKKMEEDVKLNIELQLTYTKEGTDDTFITENYVADYKTGTAGDFQNLFSNYENNLYRLLIIGDPGSGKSTLLLRFARKLIKNALEDHDYPVPIILNVASWRSNCETFTEWLEKNLVYYGGEYGTSKANAKVLAHSYKLILLLDGLDEIPKGHRAHCLEKLQDYLRDLNKHKTGNYPELILTSRIEEYKVLDANAPVQATVTIEPVDPADLSKVLQELAAHNNVRKNAATNLKNDIDQNPLLAPLLSTAFQVHIALSLAEGNTLHAIETQTQLVDLYIKKEVGKLHAKYREKTVRGTLTWLSNHMSNSRKSVTFELTDIKDGWLKTQWIFRIICALISGWLPVVVTEAGILTGIHVAHAPHFVYLYLFGFILGLIASFEGIVDVREVRTIGINKIDFGSVKYKARSYAIPLISLVIFMLIYAKVVDHHFKFRALAFPFVCLLVVIETLGIFIVERSLPRINSPYKRIVQSFVFDAICWFFYTLITILICRNWIFASPSFTFTRIVMLAATSGVVVAIVMFPLQFAAMQLALFFERATPLNLVKFLNTVSNDTGLLEHDGGQWRFRHELIQGRFFKSDKRVFYIESGPLKVITSTVKRKSAGK